MSMPPAARGHPASSGWKEKLHRHIRAISWLRWLFETRKGEIVIAQMPNIPLIVALAADFVGYVAVGQVKEIANWIGQVSFLIWAIMEIGWGVNPFRRILGGIVLALVGFAIYRRLA
jgi:hypothetical protein